MVSIFHFVGTIALAIYVLAFFLKKSYHPIVRLIVNLLFAVMFARLTAFAPAVIYLFNAIFAVVPFYAIAQKTKNPNVFSYLVYQLIPSVIAIAVGILAVVSQNLTPFHIVISFTLPTIAILINLVIGSVTRFAMDWLPERSFLRSPWAPIVRSFIWIVYYLVAGVWVSIVYEIFNLVFFIKNAQRTNNFFTFKRRERPEGSPSPRRERPVRAASEPKKESEPIGNNTMSFASDNKNASQDATVPSVFKGQW